MSGAKYQMSASTLGVWFLALESCAERSTDTITQDALRDLVGDARAYRHAIPELCKAGFVSVSDDVIHLQPEHKHNRQHTSAQCNQVCRHCQHTLEILGAMKSLHSSLSALVERLRAIGLGTTGLGTLELTKNKSPGFSEKSNECANDKPGPLPEDHTEPQPALKAEQRYGIAFASGIALVTGAACSPPSDKVNVGCLNLAIVTHGLKRRGDELLAWIKTDAEAFARVTDPRFGGYTAKRFLAWLDAGKPSGAKSGVQVKAQPKPEAFRNTTPFFPPTERKVLTPEEQAEAERKVAAAMAEFDKAVGGT